MKVPGQCSAAFLALWYVQYQPQHQSMTGAGFRRTSADMHGRSVSLQSLPSFELSSPVVLAVVQVLLTIPLTSGFSGLRCEDSGYLPLSSFPERKLAQGNRYAYDNQRSEEEGPKRQCRFVAALLKSRMSQGQVWAE